MHILVTGAAGFIGSHVTERLLSLGHAVTGFDNFNPFYDPAIKRRNLFAARQSSQFTLMEADLRDADALLDCTTRHPIDAVIHLAAMAGVRPSIEQPALYSAVNIQGTVNVLEACRAGGISRLIFASSSSVYGANREIPFRESDRVDHPISPYAATKKAGELLCHTYHHLHGISIACLRFFTVYGPRQRPDLAIHRFTDLIEKGQPLPFFGDGSSRRDYTYIDDIVQGVLGALHWVEAGSAPRYDVFNLGESHTSSLDDLVRLLENALGKKATLKRLPDQPGDVPITFADVSKARQLLGYAPKVGMEEGLARFVDWYRAGK
jgi:UDP-glucuronate 4-epimerase